MDWYSWLSKSSLEPSLVCEYGLLFMSNELEDDDVAFFDHDFLQSMGISVAKHRLEILKLAKRERRVSPLPVSKLVAAIRKSKNCLKKYIRTLACTTDSPAIIVMPKSTPYGDNRWREATLRRKTKLALLKQGRLMIADRGVSVAHAPSRSHSASPMVLRGRQESGNGCATGDDGYWEAAVGAMRWDSMFQNMKPT